MTSSSTPAHRRGADQGRGFGLGRGRTTYPRPGASALEILLAVLPMRSGGLADEHGPTIPVIPWQAAPRPRQPPRS